MTRGSGMWILKFVFNFKVTKSPSMVYSTLDSVYFSAVMLNISLNYDHFLMLINTNKIIEVHANYTANIYTYLCSQNVG